MNIFNKTTTLNTVDADELLATPLKPINWIVKDILPQGLHILAGSPKIGKSWLMLSLCLQVAKGEPLWEYETQKCEVLYLCLEDTLNRVQSRLFQITDNAPDRLHFAVAANILNEGLKEQIEGFMKEYPDTGLIVIDTFQKVRGLCLSSNSYANDYYDVSQLKSLADKYGIALIIVHHLRKDAASDPVMMISGSTGISGGADCNYVLVKDKRALDSAKLIISGRDTEYQEILLTFENCMWHFMGCDKKEDIIRKETPPVLFDIVKFMEDKETWTGSATELLFRMKNETIPFNTVTKIINQYHSTFLLENNIIYQYQRTSKGRMLTLTKQKPDNSLHQNKLSQPSQLSSGGK